jgi:hypothetical protein
MEREELKSVQSKFNQGLEKLELVRNCLLRLAEIGSVEMDIAAVDKQRGELTFFLAGGRYYVRIRITDRSIEGVGADYNVPIGWFDWGAFDINEVRQKQIQSNYFDERGILCDMEKEEFYCDFSDCDDPRIQEGLMLKLQRLVGRTIARNNAAHL